MAKGKMNVKKVTADDNAETAEASEKKGRQVFETSELLEVAMPEGYNFKEYRPLKKEQFKSEDLYLDFMALQAEHKAQIQTDKAAEYKAKAEQFRKFGDPAKRKKANKLAKMAKAFAELKASAEEDGIDTSDINLDV